MSRDNITANEVFDTLETLREQMQRFLTQDASPIKYSITALDVRALLRRREQRLDYFPRWIVGEAGWTLLLELYAHHLERRTCSVTEVCEATTVPTTTALRTIRVLERDQPGGPHARPQRRPAVVGQALGARPCPNRAIFQRRLFDARMIAAPL